MSAVEELVVLLDEGGHATGTMPKATVHGTDTPLHLAFSCYLFDAAGRLLMTQRALSKPTWPGAWTNSVCGHPAPGEPMADAVRRRVLDEVGVRAEGVTLLLPAFRYRAVMPNGVVENEMCPVFVATTRDALAPDPAEVEDATWVDWAAFRAGRSRRQPRHQPVVPRAGLAAPGGAAGRDRPTRLSAAPGRPDRLSARGPGHRPIPWRVKVD